jgi:hypothetical protein
MMKGFKIPKKRLIFATVLDADHPPKQSVKYNNMRKYTTVIALFALVTALGSCRHGWGRRVRGNGNITSETRNVNNFKSVEVGGSINVYLSQGSPSSVKLEGDENILKYVEVYQEGDRLIIKNKDGYDLDPSGNMRVYVTAPVFDRVEASGASDIIGQGKISNPNDLEISISGAGDVKLELDAPRLKADISGSGSLHLKGETKDTEISLSGVGSAHCYDLLSENTKVDISGAGSAQVYASVGLDAQVSGVGSIHYKGNPANVKQDVSGAGSISKGD